MSQEMEAALIKLIEAVTFVIVNLGNEAIAAVRLERGSPLPDQQTRNPIR